MLIAHISDLHVARSPGFTEYNAKRFLGYINYRLFRGRLYREFVAEQALARLAEYPPDLVLLTGDITQHGLEAEFDGAEQLLDVLTQRGVPIVAVAGNHDIYGFATAERLARLIDKLSLNLQPDDDGIIRLPGVEILPLAQGVPTFPFFSYGVQDLDELSRAAAAWAGPPRDAMRLVCGHYPVIDSHGGRLIYFRGLRASEALMEFCQKHQVAAYFCGHNHKRYCATMPGGCVQYAAPALSAVRSVGHEWISVYECGADLEHPVERDRGP